MSRLLILLLLWAIPLAARADTVVSARADAVSITVYRAPGRAKGAIDRTWPRGYALITESRTIALPAGESVVRFEGVAEGLMPETAILTGLPRGVREKNRDARLLSPAGLVDAYLKRSVTLQRTDRRTGKVTRQDAILTAGPTGGVLLRTAQGYEALGCSGLPERMLYPRVPADLSARPTLSVIATADRATRARIQLTYLAEGFDWAANYVAEVGADGRADGERLDLMAWLTVANGGVTGFPGARLAVIAGQPGKRDRAPAPRPTGGSLALQCWPMDITSTHPVWSLPPLMRAGMMERAEDVVVTAQRAPMAMLAMAPPPPAPPPPPPPPEDVGDLKLYRVPGTVDVAAHAQKQVALLRQPGVVVERLYAAIVGGGRTLTDSRPMTLRLRLLNRKQDGLGLPMPAGRVALFETVGTMRLLAGEADIGDKAEGERVDYDLSASTAVRIAASVVRATAARRDWIVRLTNAHPFAARAEIAIPHAIIAPSPDMERRGSFWIWRTTIPANGTVDLAYAEGSPDGP